MKFLVTEIQTLANGAVAALTYAYDDEKPALAKYYTLLSIGAQSTLPVYSVTLCNNEGFQVKRECFKNGVSVVEDEEE